MVDKERIHRTIDELSPRSLKQLAQYIEFLRFKEQRGSDWLGELYDLFAPVRQGVIESGMTDDDVNQIIDEAIKEVRDDRKSKQMRVEKG